VLSRPLPDWNISRDNQVGIPLHFDTEGKSLYLWFESLVGYASFANSVDVDFVHFIGKNILYYHAVVWPVLLEQALEGDATRTRTSPRGFLSVEQTDASLVEIDEATRFWPVDYLRFYLAHRVPDRQVDFVLRAEELKQTCNSLLCNGAGNLIRRLATPLISTWAGTGGRIDTTDPLYVRFWEETAPALVAEVDRFRVSGAVHQVVRAIQQWHSDIEHRRLYTESSPELNGLRAFIVAATLTLLAPVVPGLVSRQTIFRGWVPSTIDALKHTAELVPEAIGQSWEPV
jgi:methionyl-tRNA synthetase